VKIVEITTHPVGAGWKNWLVVRVRTDTGLEGLGEGTLNGFARATEAAVHELAGLAVGEDPRRVTALGDRLFDRVSNDGGHIHRTAIAAITTACWDVVGKSLGAPVHALLGGRVRDSVLAYANGWYRTQRTPEDVVAAAEPVVEQGFGALKLDPFGVASGFIDDTELDLAHDIVAALRARFGRELRILVDVHARFTEADAVRAAERLAPLNVFWWEEPTTRERVAPTSAVARRCPIRVAAGETFDKVGQFFDLAAAGEVSIFQPEPMSLGGIGNTMAVAGIARGAGAWIAPHQSGGPVATAVCLQLAAAVPNFLVQEHFDAFNEPWTRDLLDWAPELDPRTGHLSLPEAPGIGVSLDLDVAADHPYDPNAYLDVHEPGWERRLGSRGAGSDA
jgi:galactonate dehydratase